MNLSIIEAHILTELDRKSERTQKEISAIFKLPQSTLASVCAQLIEHGLLSSQTGSSDKRERLYSLTLKGKALVVETDKVTDQNFKLFAASLNTSEKKDLVELFRAIADGYQEEKGALRPGEPAFRREQRRITRAFGLHTEHAFGESLTGIEWQTLNEIACKTGEIVACSLENTLCVVRGTLASTLKRLESKNLIERKSSKSNDRREKALFITAEGLKVRALIEYKATKDLAHALNKDSNAKLLRWVSVLARYTLEELNYKSGTEHLWHLRMTQTKEERTQARAFLVQHAVRKRKLLELPESIAASDMLTVLEFYKGKLFAVYDFIRERNSLILSMCASKEKPDPRRVETWLTNSSG